MWLYVVFALILVKTSLLGLGLISIGLSLVALLAVNLNLIRVHPYITQRAKRIYKTALWLHISVYGLLVAKLIMIESLEDIPLFIAGHLLFHHLMAAVIGATLLVLVIRSYFGYKALTVNDVL
ncbi:hypothetical protein [Pseudoalteromonas sp. GB56]